MSWSHFQFTLTRIRVWLYNQRMARFQLGPDPPTSYFNAFVHVATGGLGLLFTMPFATVIIWAIMLIVTTSQLGGLCLLFGGLSVLSALVGVGRWASDGWRWRTPVAVCVYASGLLYFVAAFILSFTGSGITFFGNSVHFMALNFLCIVELMYTTEDRHRVDIGQMLELSDDDLQAAGTILASPRAADAKDNKAGEVMHNVPKQGAVTINVAGSNASAAAVVPAPGTTSAGAAGAVVPPLAMSRVAFGDPLQHKFGTVAVTKRVVRLAFVLHSPASMFGDKDIT